jgi:hypothetical protein
MSIAKENWKVLSSLFPARWKQMAWQAGELYGFGKVTRDITERKRSDEKFRGTVRSRARRNGGTQQRGQNRSG